MPAHHPHEPPSPLLYVGRIPPVRGWRAQPHAHEGVVEAIVVVAGDMRVDCPDGSVVARPGDVVIHAPGRVHAESAAGAVPIEILCLSWQASGEGVGGGETWPSLVADRDGRIQMLVRWMIELRYPEPRASALLRAQFELFLQALREARDRAVRPSEDAGIERARAHIHEHLERRLPLDELARVARLSRYHFARRFRSSVGASPITYVRTLRVHTARALIANTDLPLRVIAERVGIPDEARLYRIVKSVTGHAPGWFRGTATR